MTFRYHLYAEKGVKRTAVPKGHPLAAAVLLVKMKIEEVLKNPHDRQKAHEIMFQKSQTASKTHIDDDKEHRKYVPAMTNRAEKVRWR